jgi:hypothetical protein
MLKLHLKTSGIAAIGAFVLSFFIGIIGGAGFPLLLFRALLFSAVFFILSEGIYFITERFLADKPPPVSGSRVDIVVDDETAAETVLDDAEAAAESAEDGGALELPTSLADIPTPLSDIQPADDPRPVDAEDGASVDAAEVAASEGAVVEETASVDGASTDGASIEAASSDAASTAMLDVGDAPLPDMEGMSRAFNENDEEDLFEPPPRRTTPERSVEEVLGKHIDPKKVAGAIRTLLKQG